MSWTTRQKDRFLQLAEQGRITTEQLRQADQLDSLQPTPEAWRTLAERISAYGGGLLLGAALIFFFAYNWADLHRFAKFGLAFGGLGSCLALACFCQPNGTLWRASLLAGNLCCGALLALIGQTYQTGADPWELFFAWALLGLPLTLLSRSTASGLLWLLVCNLALLLWQIQAFEFDLFSAESINRPLLSIAASNLVLLLLLEGLGRVWLYRPSRLLPRAAALLTLLPLVLGGCLAWWQAEASISAWAMLATCAVLLLYYRYRRLDSPILALVASTLIAWTTSGLLVLLDDTPHFIALNLIGVYLIATSAGALVWLKRLPATQGETA